MSTVHIQGRIMHPFLKFFVHKIAWKAISWCYSYVNFGNSFGIEESTQKSTIPRTNVQNFFCTHYFQTVHLIFSWNQSLSGCRMEEGEELIDFSCIKMPCSSGIIVYNSKKIRGRTKRTTIFFFIIYFFVAKVFSFSR